MSEPKKNVITAIRRDLLRYFKECTEDESFEHFDGLYSNEDLTETFKWLLQKKCITDCGRLKYKLNERGLELLNEVEGKIQEKQQDEVKLTEKEVNAKSFDRTLDNSQKVLNIIFAGAIVVLAFLTLLQGDKSKDIIELQRLRKVDSLLFSKSLDSLENQLIQHNKRLQNSPSNTQKGDSAQ